MLEKEGKYYLAALGYRKPVPVVGSGFTKEEVDYPIENQEA